jgi:hypothetical protein
VKVSHSLRLYTSSYSGCKGLRSRLKESLEIFIAHLVLKRIEI